MPLQQINVSPLGGSSSPRGLTEQQSNITSKMSRDLPGCYESQTSSISSNSYDICRICHCEGDSDVPLIAPCYCAGSLRYVHQACLQQWIKSSNIRSCELCKFQFIMQTKTKPFSEWEHLEMSGFERRKLFCAVMFHAVALTCIVWSLYVLIDRTADEIQSGALEWPFWTKLIVVAIGFTGGVVFMYIQCKAYLQICQRWKAFNRVIYVQNAPEKPSLSPAQSAECLQNGEGPIAQSSAVQQYIHRPAIPSSSEFKPYQDGVRDAAISKDETSIDLKGVRNLHIFFNDENRIHVQKDRSPSCSADYLEEGEVGGDTNGVGPNGSGGNPNGGNSCPDNHSMSWHIKIGKTGESNERAVERMPDSNQVQDENQRPGTSNDLESPVLKLQIKKAEIVIKFGQKSSNSGAAMIENNPVDDKTIEEHQCNNESSVNIKIDSREKDNSEPIVIDLVQNQTNQTVDPQESSSNPVQIRLDFGCKDVEQHDGSEDALKLLPDHALLNARPTSERLYRPRNGNDSSKSKSEPGSGSQSPLLTCKDCKL